MRLEVRQCAAHHRVRDGAAQRCGHETPGVDPQAEHLDRAFGVLTRGSRYGVAVLPLAGGEPLWIPSDSVATGLSGIFQWAPDETGVYYTTAERANLLFYRFGMAAETSLTRLTGDAILFNGAISRDGRTMLVTRGAQGRDVFLITMPR